MPNRRGNLGTISHKRCPWFVQPDDYLLGLGDIDSVGVMLGGELPSPGNCGG